MRVLKNLLGDGSKIHAGEIQVNTLLNLMDSVIVEEGSNNDGSYIRFGNGWQICWNEKVFADRIATELYGEVYSTSDVDWNFPKSFSSLPLLIPTARRFAGGGAWGGHSGNVHNDRATSLRMLGTHNTSRGTLGAFVIGRY